MQFFLYTTEFKLEDEKTSPVEAFADFNLTGNALQTNRADRQFMVGKQS
jgi:hypothetical protein